MNNINSINPINSTKNTTSFTTSKMNYMNNTNNHSPINNKLDRFLLWVSNVDLDTLNECPKYETQRYKLIGTILLFLGALSFFSAYYAITETQLYSTNPFTQILLAFIIASIIFNIDRYLISSIIVPPNTLVWKKVFSLSFFIRLILSILIGIVISTPIEIKLFEDKIQNYILHKKIKENDTLRNKNFEDQNIQQSINRYASELEQYQNELKNLKSEKERNEKKLNTYGFGYIIVEKYDGFNQIKKEKKLTYEGIKAKKEIGKLEEKIANIEQNIQQLENSKAEKIRKQDSLTFQNQRLEEELYNSQQYKLLEKLSILDEIKDTNSGVRFAHWIIMLFFIMLDCVPIIAKTISDSIYDSKIYYQNENKKNEWQYELEKNKLDYKFKTLNHQRETDQIQFQKEMQDLKNKFEKDEFISNQSQKEILRNINFKNEQEKLQRKNKIDNFNDIVIELNHQHEVNQLKNKLNHIEELQNIQNKQEIDKTKIMHAEKLKSLINVLHNYQQAQNDYFNNNLHNQNMNNSDKQ